MHFFLIGFMGAGKSYLGRAMAARLGFDFVDLDDTIEADYASTIASIFQQRGEAHFRQLEAAAIRSLDPSQNLVVATGGGAPCFHSNMDWMNAHGITIYLYAPAALLATRLLPEKPKRPLIATVENEQLVDFVEVKLAERAVFYNQSQIQFNVPEAGLDGLEALCSYLMRFLKK